MSYLNNLTIHELKYGGSRPSTANLMDLVMAHITAGQLRSCTRGELLSGTARALLSGVSIDTRTLQPADLFFAIRGPRRDGHLFVEEALKKGAAGAVVDHHYVPPEDFPSRKILLQVEDTHRALLDLASEVRNLWRGSLIGITGSMGKTTVKEFMGQILQTEYSVYRSPGNYNNLFGLPLALFNLSPEDHIGVFEMGMSAAGEIAEMCTIARPDLGVITNVAPVHLEFFGSVERIAAAKAELADGLGPDGTLLYNADDPLVSAIAARFAGRKISFGLSDGADVRAEGIEITGLSETRFRLVSGGIMYRAAIPMCGLHYVMNVLPAVAAASYFKIDAAQVLESLRQLQPVQMRGRILQFEAGFTVIDDSYNSNPRALTLMIETAAKIPFFNRRILVAGEMLELGPESAALHRRCGTRAAECGMDVVVGIQGAARELAQGALSAGLRDRDVYFFTEVNPAIDLISRKVEPGDLVLIKGSRGVHLERMVRVLRSDFKEQ